jgi:hypothetical protein
MEETALMVGKAIVNVVNRKRVVEIVRSKGLIVEK